MANRFPLIVDTTDSNKIKELPEGDQLDLSNSGIANLTSLSVAGNLSGGAIQSSGTISSTGNATVGGNASITGTLTVGSTGSFTGAITAASVTSAGTIDAASFTVNGNPLSSIQVQSDWDVTDVNSAAFIKNKPTLNTIESIFDITDVEEGFGGTNVGDVLAFESDDGGATFVMRTNNRFLTDTDVLLNSNPASGDGSLTLTPGAGFVTFDFTPASIPRASTELTDSASLIRTGNNVSLLTNDSGFIAGSDVAVSTPITKTPISGNQFAIGFDNSTTGYISSVTTDANFSGSGNAASQLELAANITVGSISATDGATASTFENVEVLSLTFNAGGVSSLNGAINLTNGNITATNGTITGNYVDATEFRGSTVSNIGGNLTVAANNLVLNTNPSIKMGQNASLPGSPAVGDVWHTGQTLATYVADDGTGSAGWIYLGGVSAPGGISLPVFTNSTRPSFTKAGQMILNTDTSTVQVSTGSSWIDVGP